MSSPKQSYKKKKTTRRHHLTLFRMAIIQKNTIITVGKDVEKKEHLNTVGENAK